MATATQYSRGPSSEVNEGYGRPLAIMAALFFFWGLLSYLNEILVAHLRSIFDLSTPGRLLVQFGFCATCFLLALPAARLVDWIGFHRTMVAGLFAMAAGAFLFVPAATFASYPLFLAALVAFAAGITVLGVAANPYVVVAGRTELASSRLTLAHASYMAGTALAPAVGGLVILSAAPVTLQEIQNMSPEAFAYYRLAQAAAVRMPYVLIGVMLIVVAAAIGSVRLPDIVSAERRPGLAIADKLWRHPALIFGCIGIFACVGAELLLGGSLVRYLIQPRIGHLSERAAEGFATVYWLAAVAGRFLGSAMLRRVKTPVLLGGGAFAASTLIAISLLTSGQVALWSILAAGLFGSIVLPCVFTLAIAELGPLTADGAGVVMMASAAGAVVPTLLAGASGARYGLIASVLCYVYVLLFAMNRQLKNPS